MSRYVLAYKEETDRIDKYYDLSSQIPAMYLIEGVMNLMQKHK